MKTAFYSEKQLDEITSLSKMTRWRLRRKGNFPGSVQLSAGRVGYSAKAIDEWIAERLKSQEAAA